MKNVCFFFAVFFFKLLPKFSDLINPDDCIGKILSKSIRLTVFSFYSKNELRAIKNGTIFDKN